MHKTLGLKYLVERRDIKMALECHKHVYQAKSSLAGFFKRKNPGRQTRRSNSIQIGKTRTELGKRAFSIRGPLFWNKLMDNLTQKDDFNKFKAEVMRTFALFVDHPT